VANNLGYRTIVVADASACSELIDADGHVIPAVEVSRAHLATLRAEFAEVVDSRTVCEALANANRACAVA
jgi:hypothetical protein